MSRKYARGLMPEHLAGRDQGERVRAAMGALVVAHEEPRFAIQNPSTNIAFDFVVGHLHARVGQKHGEPLPLTVQVPSSTSSSSAASITTRRCSADHGMRNVPISKRFVISAQQSRSK